MRRNTLDRNGEARRFILCLMNFEKPFEHAEALLAASFEEFATRGYDKASLNRILEGAGMSKGQFYYHFKNKEGLYLALVEIMVNQKRAFLNQTIKEGGQTDIYAILQAQLKYDRAFFQRYPILKRFSESFDNERGTPIYATALERFNYKNETLLHSLVELAHKKGDFRKDLPLPFIQEIVSYLFEHAAEMIDLSDPDRFDANLNHLITFIRAGLSGFSVPGDR